MMKSFLTLTAALAFCVLLTACSEGTDSADDVQPRPVPTEPLQPPTGPGAGMGSGGDAGGATGGTRTGG